MTVIQYMKIQPVPYSHRDFLRQSLLQKLHGLIGVPSGHVLSIDLQDLIAKAKSDKSGRRIVVDKRNK